MEIIGLVFNSQKQNAIDIANKLVAFFKANNHRLVIPEHLAEIINSPEFGVTEEDFTSLAQAVIVLGGDGTLLNTARMVAHAGIPLLGINLGSLGFLNECEVGEIDKALEILLSGNMIVEERMMLLGEVVRDGKTIDKFYALNDIVISKGAFARMITVETFVDQEFLFAYPADGLIISSPTGSTAYSLSAGGPIAHPEMQLMILTPICAHTLYARPVIVSHRQKVRAVLRSTNTDVMLTSDGQYGIKLATGDEVLVSAAPFKTRLIKLKENNFFHVLRQKLREGSTKDRV